MPGLSSRQPVSGMDGLGKIHIKYTLRKKRSFPWGLLLYLFAIGFCVTMWSWSNIYMKHAFVIPFLQYVLYRADNFRFYVYTSNDMLSSLNEKLIKVKVTPQGSPLIISPNISSTLMGQGYVHASNRIYQMEILRRLASGTLSELFGKSTLALDRFSKTFNIKELSQNDYDFLDDGGRELLDSYVLGVNEYLNHNGFVLPFEFWHLGIQRHEISPWTPLDTLSIFRLLGFLVSHGLEEEIIESYLKVIQSPKQNKLFRRQYSSNTNSENDYNNINDETKQYSNNFAPAANGQSWVKSGASPPADGTIRMLMSCDLHTEPNLVSMLYDMSLITPEINLTGGSLPGLPLILVGKNKYLSWCLTQSLLDTEDSFIESFAASENSLQDVNLQPHALLDEDQLDNKYHTVENQGSDTEGGGGTHNLSPGIGLKYVMENREHIDKASTVNTTGGANKYLWGKAVIRKEIINIRNEAPVIESFISTIRGPIINSLFNSDTSTAVSVIIKQLMIDVDSQQNSVTPMNYLVSLRNIAMSMSSSITVNSTTSSKVDESLRTARGGMTFLRNICFARTVEDVEAASISLNTMSFNLVFATQSGDIGYFVTGSTPIRASSYSGSTLTDASILEGGQPWTSFIPSDKLPQSINPQDGIIISGLPAVRPRLHSLLSDLHIDDNDNDAPTLSLGIKEVISNVLCDAYSPSAVALFERVQEIPSSVTESLTSTCKQIFKHTMKQLQDFRGDFSATSSSASPLILASLRRQLLQRLRRPLAGLSNIMYGERLVALTSSTSTHSLSKSGTWLMDVISTSNDSNNNMSTDSAWWWLQQSLVLGSYRHYQDQHHHISPSEPLATTSVTNDASSNQDTWNDHQQQQQQQQQHYQASKAKNDIDLLIADTLCSTIDDLRKDFGQSSRWGAWRWGRAHTFTFTHPLQELPVLGDVYSGARVAIGGYDDTVFLSQLFPSSLHPPSKETYNVGPGKTVQYRLLITWNYNLNHNSRIDNNSSNDLLITMSPRCSSSSSSLSRSIGSTSPCDMCHANSIDQAIQASFWRSAVTTAASASSPSLPDTTTESTSQQTILDTTTDTNNSEL